MDVAEAQFRTDGPQRLTGRQRVVPPPGTHQDINPQLRHILMVAILLRHPLQFGERFVRHSQFEVALGGIDVVLQGDAGS